MSNKQRGLLAIFILVAMTIMISACTQSLSAAPAATPTLLPADLFVSPIPSVENPMAMIEEFAKQTSVAQTTVANGGTPVTPQAIVVGTVITPQAGTAAVTTPGTDSTPTNAAGGVSVIVASATPGVGVVNTPGAITTAGSVAPVATTPVPAVSNPTAVPSGARPASYTLQNGEFPYCIARRFNVNPDALLSANGLSNADILYPGKTLSIPQSGAFPGDRMLASHPTTYSVLSGDETIYSVACKFGDVDPASIASANGISVSAKLTAGQKLQIP